MSPVYVNEMKEIFALEDVEAARRRRLAWSVIAGYLLLAQVCLAAAYLRSVALREDDPPAFIEATVKLAFTSATVTTVGADPHQLLAELHTPSPIINYMAQQGWHPVQPIQMGATYYFGKGKRGMEVRSRACTGRYRFHQIILTP